MLVLGELQSSRERARLRAEAWVVERWNLSESEEAGTEERALEKEEYLISSIKEEDRPPITYQERPETPYI